jgi:alpha-L-fucosidase
VRFTQRNGSVYAMLLDLPQREFGIRGVDATAVTEVRMLGLDEPVEWRVADGLLTVRLPDRMPVSPVHVLSLGGGLRSAG